MTRSKTTLIKFNRRLKEEIQIKFPEIPIGNVLAISYRTSLVGLEGALRGKPKKFKKK